MELIDWPPGVCWVPLRISISAAPEPPRWPVAPGADCWSDLASGASASTTTTSLSGAASPKPSSMPPSRLRMMRMRGPMSSIEVGTTAPENRSPPRTPTAARGARATRFPSLSFNSMLRSRTCGTPVSGLRSTTTPPTATFMLGRLALMRLSTVERMKSSETGPWDSRR